jgi:hypothetical protein
MEYIIGFALVVGLVMLIATQVAARQQVDLDVRRPRSESAEIIDRYFGPVWLRVSGPGTYNFRPKMRMHAPIISVTLRGSEATSHISVWTSHYKTVYGGMYHAGLMWRKKRGLAKRLQDS